MKSQSQAYFLGKRALLDWINNFLGLKVTKVEECATGAIYCQLLDSLYPGRVDIKKVDYSARQSWEYMKNWKIVQTIFKKESIPKKIPVEKLVKGRFQDNLEFLQWFYHFFHQQAPNPPEYDASSRRALSKKNDGHSAKKPGKKRGLPSAKKLVSSSPVGKKSRIVKKIPLNRRNYQVQELQRQMKKLKADLKQKTSDYDEMFKSAKGIEKERDYYYEKMVAVDAAFEKEADSKLKKKILRILYDQPGTTKSSPEPGKRSSLPEMQSQTFPPTRSQPTQQSKEADSIFTQQSIQTQHSEVSTASSKSRIQQELSQQDFGETYDQDSSGLFDMSGEAMVTQWMAV